MLDLLSSAYPWVKVLHISSVIAWMAGLLYLPRLFVYHAERGSAGGTEPAETLAIMERKLLRIIMNPAMTATWAFGLLLAGTPGVVDWGAGYIYVKLTGVVGLTLFHHWLARRRKDFVKGANRFPARTYRMVNELPMLVILLIVTMIVVRPF